MENEAPQSFLRSKKLPLLILLTVLFICCSCCLTFTAIGMLSPQKQTTSTTDNTVTESPKGGTSTPTPTVEAKPSTPEPRKPLASVQEFEQSDFYKNYQIYKNDTWDLKSGGQNHAYGTDKFGKGLNGVEVTVKNGSISGYGISFYSYTSRQNITEDEFAMISDLIKLVTGKDTVDDPMKFVRGNIATPVKDIYSNVYDTKPYSWNGFTIHVVKIDATTFVFAMDKQ